MASVAEPALTLYQAEWCPFSSAVREVLTELGLDFVARQVEPWPEQREGLQALAGTDQIPVLQAEDGELYRGTRAIFDHLREREPESGRRPIHHRRGQRHRLDVDSLPVHAIEAKAEIDELLVEGVGDSLGSDRIAAACLALKPRSFGRTVSLEQVEPVRGIPMRMGIDGARRMSWRRRVIVSRRDPLGHRRALRCSGLHSME